MKQVTAKRLNWLVREERRTIDPSMTGSETVFHYSIPALDELGDGQLESVDAIGSAKLLLSGGEVLISKLNPRLPRVLLAESHDVPTLASTEFIALRPGPDVDERFLRYWLGSERLRQDLNGATMSVTRSQQRVRPEVLTTMWVAFPKKAAQQAIADFLDAETARIDALIAKKQTLLSRLHERHAGEIEHVIRALAANHGELPLKFLASDVTVGIVVTPAAWYVDQGVPAIRGIDVKPGTIRTDDLVQISPEGHALHSKSALRAGDVVVVRTGQAGAAAVVPPFLDGANCIDVLIVRPGPRLVSRFLEFVLNSDWTQKHVDEHSVGTIQTHFNVGALDNLSVPRAPIPQQAEAVERLSEHLADLDAVVTRLARQINLLRERRQALITAAVTGDLEIPGAAA